MKNIRYLLSFFRPYYRKIILSLIFATGASAIPGSTAVLVKPFFDYVFIEKRISVLYWLIAGTIALYTFRGVCRYLQSYFIFSVGQMIIRDLRVGLYEKLLSQEIKFFEKRRTGDILSRINNDVTIVQMGLSAVVGVLREPFTLVGLTAAALYMNWKMALLTLIILPFGVFPMIKITRILKGYGIKVQQLLGKINSIVEESIFSIKIIKIFNAEEYSKERFKKDTNKIADIFINYMKLQEITSPLMEFLGALGISAIIFFGAMDVIDGRTTTGSFFAFLAAAGFMYDPVKRMNTTWAILQQSIAAAQRLKEILELPAGEIEVEDAIEFNGIREGILFEDVSFAYDSKNILNNINLEIRKGERVAIVGQSGVGKTTLVNFIPRFIEPSKGRITIDGINIKQFRIQSLRANIAMVTQEVILFNDTIMNNILIGKPSASISMVEEVCKASGIHSFIERLPEKYHTYIGEKGAFLSGGQKQKLSIARALIKGAPILIMDEPTSSVDTESEKEIQEAMSKLLSDKTSLIIAHRLSTIKMCDKIVVISDGGRIAETGTHSELIQRGGEYYRLYKQQMDEENLKE